MPNALTYISNLSKSVAYTAVDTFKEMNPTIEQLASDNADLGKIIYESIKDVKGATRKAKDAFAKSDVGEFAIQYKKSLFEDILAKTDDEFTKNLLLEWKRNEWKEDENDDGTRR